MKHSGLWCVQAGGGRIWRRATTRSVFGLWVAKSEVGFRLGKEGVRSKYLA